MTPEELSQTIVDALVALDSRGALTLPDVTPSKVVVERPKIKEHGDYATNVALQLPSGPASPRESWPSSSPRSSGSRRRSPTST